MMTSTITFRTSRMSYPLRYPLGQLTSLCFEAALARYRIVLTWVIVPRTVVEIIHPPVTKSLHTSALASVVDSYKRARKHLSYY
jgi:hypothetical protein